MRARADEARGGGAHREALPGARGVRRLRARLIVLVLVCVVPAAALVAGGAWDERGHLESEARSRTEDKARDAAAELTDALGSARELLVALSSAPVVRDRDAGEAASYFAALLERYQHYEDLALVDAQGKVLAAGSGRAHVGESDRAFIERTLRSESFTVSDYRVSGATRTATLLCAVPVFNDSGAAVAVVVSLLRLGKLEAVAEELGLPEGASLMVVDRKGTVIARQPDVGEWVGRALPETGLVRTILSLDSGSAEAEGLDGVRRVYGFSTAGRGDQGVLHVAVGFDAARVYAPAYEALARELAALGLATALALGLAWSGAERFALRGLRPLLRATERVRAGDLTARVGSAHVVGELGDLAGAFDEMAGSLQTREEHLKRLNRLYSVLSKTNSAVVRTSDRRALFAEVCRIAVSVGGLRGAWVGIVDRSANAVVPEASAGPCGECFTELEFPVDERAGSACLFAEAVRSGASVIVDDVQSDHRMVPWREQAGIHGCRSMATFPLLGPDGVVALFTVSSTEPGYLGTDELALLEEVAADLSYAMRAMETVEAQRSTALALEASERSLRALFASMGEVVLSTDADFRVADCNQPATRDVLGHGDGLLGSDAGTLFTDVEAARSAFELVGRRAAAKPVVVEAEMRRKDGRVFQAELTVSRLVGEAGRSAVAMAVIRDITERTRVERLRGDLLGMVSHELRTPLAVIIGHAMLMERWVADGNTESALKGAQTIRRRGDEMHRLVDQILRAINLQHGDSILRRQPTPIDFVVGQALATLVSDRREAVDVDMPDSAAVVDCDPELVAIAISNLADNALKFSPPDARVRIRVGFEDGAVSVRVTDEGAGIEEADLERVFGPFAQLDMSSTRQYGGVGMGLYVVKLVAEAHGGSIRVESTPGEGSTFTLTLPCGEAEPG